MFWLRLRGKGETQAAVAQLMSRAGFVDIIWDECRGMQQDASGRQMPTCTRLLSQTPMCLCLGKERYSPKLGPTWSRASCVVIIFTWIASSIPASLADCLHRSTSYKFWCKYKPYIVNTCMLPRRWTKVLAWRVKLSHGQDLGG